MNSKKQKIVKKNPSVSKTLIFLNSILLLLFLTNAIISLDNRDIMNEKILNEPTTNSVKALSINKNNIQFNSMMSINYIITGMVGMILNVMILSKYMKSD